MAQPDTVKLLRECDAGIKMGVSSIDDVLPYVGEASLRQRLENCRREHVELKSQLQEYLDACHDDGKEPSAMAKGMSWMKTNVKLAINESDKTIADLMTDGCNMGVKSLHRYLNQYTAADENAKDMARQLSHVEEQLVTDLRGYL